MAKELTFFDSLKAGMKGMLAGAIILGAIGFATGGLLGAAMGAVGAAKGGAIAAGLIGAAGFTAMGAIAGSLIGAFTGVAGSREPRAPDPQDIINIANISFAQGVEVGKSQGVATSSKEAVMEAAAHFQDRIKSEPTRQLTR